MAGTAAEPAGSAAAAAAETAGPDRRAARHSVVGPGTQERLHGHFFIVMQMRYQSCKWNSLAPAAAAGMTGGTEGTTE